MIARLRDTGESWLLGFWLALPLLGHLTAPFYILSAPFCRNRAGRFQPALMAFCALCAVYVAWIAFVSLRAGPASAAWEPIGDAGSLLITAGLAAYVLRGARPLAMGRVYQGAVIVLIAVFALAALAHAGFGIHRPGLLMKNPLNLSPLLIVPALICTLAAHAPSRRWRAAGVLAFFLAALTLLLILQARGSALVLVGLALFRVGWILLMERPPARPLRPVAAILGPLVLALGVAALDGQVAQRFGVLGAVPVSSSPPDSPSVARQADTAPAPTDQIAPDALAPRQAEPAENVPAGEAPAAETPASGASADGTSPQAAPAQPPASNPASNPASTSDPAPNPVTASMPKPMPAGPDTSVNLRLAMLQAGWQAFLEAPWLGHGGQNRFEAATPYLPEDFPEFSHLHNEFLTHAVAGGVPAVALLCLILAFPLLCALRAPTREKLHTALLFSGAFTGTALTNNVLFVDISAFAIALNTTIAIQLISKLK